MLNHPSIHAGAGGKIHFTSFLGSVLTILFAYCYSFLGSILFLPNLKFKSNS